MPQQKWIAGKTAADIASSIERGLHRGRTGGGDSLPTVRELAENLAVSPATVAAAYKLLRMRGLISGQGRRGTRVASRPPTPSAARHAPVPENAVDLATGNPDPTLLPPLEPALRTISPAPRLYGDPPHVRDFLVFAAGEFEADKVDARWLTVVSGALDGIERTLREHLRSGDRVAVEDPSFPGIVDLLRASGCAAVPFAVDGEGPVPEQLEAALRRGCEALVVTPRAQNPTGGAITPRRATDLHRVLKRFPDPVLIENDYAGPISGAPATTLCDGTRQRWAVIRSTSKFLGPDLRVAVMAGDEMTIARVQGRQALGARWVSGILQQLALATWSDPSSARRLARAAEIYTQRRTALVAALGARGIQAHGVSGLNVWVPVSDESSIVRGLAEQGWAVAAGERFRISASPGIRITIATLTPPEAERFSDALAEVWRATSPYSTAYSTTPS